MKLQICGITRCAAMHASHGYQFQHGWACIDSRSARSPELRGAHSSPTNWQSCAKSALLHFEPRLSKITPTVGGRVVTSRYRHPCSPSASKPWINSHDSTVSSCCPSYAEKNIKFRPRPGDSGGGQGSHSGIAGVFGMPLGAPPVRYLFPRRP